MAPPSDDDKDRCSPKALELLSRQNSEIIHAVHSLSEFQVSEHMSPAQMPAYSHDMFKVKNFSICTS
ncbi:Hypothetical predicted protein [Marmota monax]|uniref:Uncharacterized protein n=1 Tax=Marmota monax TaxID=9995 RepID=A0A5E4A965_MARMO|nr:hypothetical protein GHT09_007215 [Marmota monax]VTJ53813.1 Hypothetical predicted protein [Marmota monax]